ncbi:MAG: hypothetical protein CM15mP83_1360 [Flavobacteriaceae bacterium]|nr:MAG: hypothetical protein CM15mP83_1360 [Flavobacteriaceae bacterium]
MIEKAKHTAFGKDHNFDQIQSHKDFIKQVPIADYEASPICNRVVEGETGCLWPGKPCILRKHQEQLRDEVYSTDQRINANHIEAAKNALFCHIEATDDASFVDGKMIFLQGAQSLKRKTELIWDVFRALWLIMYQNTFKKPITIMGNKLH